MDFDVIIVGGGAAGLFCARTAGLRGRRVVVLEHQSRLGNKILISGGGRCNFTNVGATPANYITHGSPHFHKSALARFTPSDFLVLVKHHGIAWHEKKLGQLFCDHSSRQILQLLEDECAQAGVSLRVGCRVESVHRQPDVAASPATATGSGCEATEWVVATSQGSFTARSLVIATGGLSFPKLGATPWGYALARQFGLRVIEPRPGLVPLTWGSADRADFGELSGISVDCEMQVAGAPRFRENLLFTHRGLSGPAVLQSSSYWHPGEGLQIDLLPGRSAHQLLTEGRAGGREVKALLRPLLPERFVQLWCQRHAPSRPVSQLPRGEIEALARDLHQWQVQPAGDEGYPKAEVTVGGIDTVELSSKTLECRRVPELYFIGEIVDVTGWLGGYNFQWAWASGYAAGSFV